MNKIITWIVLRPRRPASGDVHVANLGRVRVGSVRYRGGVRQADHATFYWICYLPKCDASTPSDGFVYDVEEGKQSLETFVDAWVQEAGIRELVE